MPREVVHWAVVQEACRLLAPDSLARQCLTSYPAVAQLGAVAHDAPYYRKGGGSLLQPFANLLHGSAPGDPSAPLASALAHSTSLNTTAEQHVALAFVLGMYSHACTDITFHPFVFYFTGEYHDSDPQRRLRAQQRHRILEVYLDMWMCKKAGHSLTELRIADRLDQSKPHSETIAKVLQGGLLPGIRAAFAEELGTMPALPGDSELAKEWYCGLEDMAWYQKLFFSTSIGVVAKVLASLFPGSFGPLEALFLYGREKDFQTVLAQPFLYRNPVTGVQCEDDIESLLQKAVGYYVDVCQSIDRLVAGQGSEGLDTLLARRSLNYGERDAEIGKAQFFSTQGIALRDLWFEHQGE